MLELLTMFRMDVDAMYDQGRVHGRSWEMAATMAILGKEGTYSGTVSSYNRSTGLVTFGPVGGVNIKSTLNNVVFWYDIPYVRIHD